MQKAIVQFASDIYTHDQCL